MRQIKKTIKDQSFNSNLFLEKLYHNEAFKKNKTPLFSMKRILVGLGTLGILLVVGAYVFTSTANPVVAYVSIDINPSFELSMLKDGTVLSVEQVNEDALRIKVSDLVGLNIEKAVDRIVERSADAGFINLDDIVEDFILVTTILTEDAQESTTSYISNRIQKQIEESETLQEVNVIEVKAELRAKFEAEGKDIPIGLYVINGEVLQEDGSYLSAKDFFSNDDHLKQLETSLNAKVTTRSMDQLRKRIEATLSDLTLQGIDVSTYQTRLVNATEATLTQIQKELLIMIDNLSETSTKATGNDQEKPDQSPNQNASENAGKKN